MKFNFCRKSNKKAIMQDMLIWVLIGVALLALIVGSIFYLNSKGINALDYIKDLFRFKGQVG